MSVLARHWYQAAWGGIIAAMLLFGVLPMFIALHWMTRDVREMPPPGTPPGAAPGGVAAWIGNHWDTSVMRFVVSVLLVLALAVWGARQYQLGHRRPHHIVPWCPCVRCRMRRSALTPLVLCFLLISMNDEFLLPPVWEHAVSLMGMLLIAIFVGVQQGFRWRRMQDLTHCRCGYDISKASSPRCPECGVDIRRLALEQIRRRMDDGEISEAMTSVPSPNGHPL